MFWFLCVYFEGVIIEVVEVFLCVELYEVVGVL